MSWNSKVVWSEGMFLRPQHFQQQDRYMEAFARGRCDSLRPYDWGIKTLELDEETLALGKLAIRTCQGILPDGTPFKIPDDDDPPRPLEIDANLRDTKVVLALPLRRVGMGEVGRELGDETVARYQVMVCEVRDTNFGIESTVPLEIGKSRLRLILDQGPQQADYATLGVARISEKRPDQRLVLDKDYLPPCLDCRAAPGLARFITEILGLLHQRGEALAGRVSESGRGGVAEIADFLLLQVINRFEPLFAHLDIMTGLHPESFYQIALQLVGELSTFVTESKRPASFPPYRHDDLQNTFAPLMQELRQLLSLVLEQNAILLPLEERKYGIRVSPITDRNLLAEASFVLAVSADVPSETLRSRFPAQAKVGPVERIAQLVNSALPGILLRPLPVAPRQIPYRAGATYFELERSGDYWKDMQNSAAFAFHIGGQFPGIDMAFWAIKR